MEDRQLLAPQVRFYPPAPGLRDLVTAYYFVDVPPGRQLDHLHPEWANIRFVVEGVWKWRMREEAPWFSTPAGLWGPTDRTGTILTEGGLVVGFGLTPLGWSRLIGVSAEPHANGAIDLGELWGPAAAEMLQSLLESTDDAARVAVLDARLGPRAQAAAIVDPAVGRAAGALLTGDIRSIGAFARQVGVSTRTLDRLCRRVFGFAPKRLLRRQRFLRTLERIGGRAGLPLGAVLDEGYADQAHFTREFRAFMGMTPSAYYDLPRNVLRRAAESRLAVIGQPLQGLHGAPGQA
ncbi:MAG: AraC family transcriptional regulator [Gammaproteobacteria bacterium]|nr:MAG: AraC family transcriptional regulator [Gammaproteobacteria bacterium]